MESLEGRTLADRYLVEKLIGEGGMGAVYSARQLGLDREVAIKVLRPEVAAGGVESERFRREALASARLDHPNIVHVYDFGHTEAGEAFLVMELLRGPSLSDWLLSTRHPDPAAIVDVLEPVCSAVDALHAAGIVHRDIKPANVSLPDPKDRDDVVKLIDLGISRFADSARGDLTGHLIIGTAEYIAPEVAAGAQAGPASDVYALAIMAFEALVGYPPFTGETDREILLQHIRTPPPLASRARRGLPAAFDDVLAHGLAKDPDERTPTARGLAAGLRAALATAPVEAAPAPARRPSRTVLVVAADGETRAFVRQCLGAFGYEIAEAADAVEALLALGGKPFDLVVASDDLAGIDAATFLRLKVEKGLGAPVVLATPSGALPDGVTAATHAVAATVALPLDAGTLFAAVTTATM